MPRWLTNLIIIAGLGLIAAVFFTQINFIKEKNPDSLIDNTISLNTTGLVTLSEWLAARPTPPSKEISLLMVGDVMLSREVGLAMTNKGYDYPFDKVRELIQSTDLAVANLESPVIEGQPVARHSMVFRADPEAVAAMARAGFDAVNLANNHFMNQGIAGANKTFEYLKANNLGAFGARPDVKNPSTSFWLKEINGLKIGFLGYAYGPEYDIATDNKPGIVLMNDEQLAVDLQYLKNWADFVVVVMHDGIEYRTESAPHQQAFAHLAIDLGADLVVGHHPHAIQEIEKYQGKYIFYSLGNFIFDQEWSLPTKQGLAVKFLINEDGVEKYELIPVVIENYAQPRLPVDSEKQSLLDKIKIVN